MKLQSIANESNRPGYLSTSVVLLRAPDIHIFAHVHKEGGKVHTDKATRFFNVSHISPLPYRLTGRKFLRMNITKESVSAAFDHVILEKNLPFDEFIERYL